MIGSNPANRTAYRLALEDLPGRKVVVKEAETTKAGLGLCGDKPPNLILLDFPRPDASAPAALDQLAQETDLAFLPVIILTSRGNTGEAVAVMKAGAADYLIKDDDGTHLKLLPTLAERALEQARVRRGKKRAEEALRDSESRFAAFLDSVPGYTFVKDREGRYLAYNTRTEPYDPQRPASAPSPIGLTDEEIYPAEAAHRYRVQDRRVLETGRVVEVIEPGPGPLADRTFLTKKFPLITDGKPELVAGVSLDITNQIKAEGALRESEERFRQLVQRANSIIIKVSTQGLITFANDYALSFFGYRLEDLIGQPAMGTIIPIRDSRNRDLRAMVDSLLTRPDKHPANENENIKQNGERVWISWTNQAIRDKDGRVIEIMAIGNDITARHRAEMALRTIVETTAPVVGLDFFDRMAEGIKDWLDCDLVVVGELTEDNKIRSLAAKDESMWQVEGNLSLSGTPFEKVVTDGFQHHPEGVAQLFPEDEYLARIKAEGYVGLPLLDAAGWPIGAINAISRRPMPLPEGATDLIRVIAARAASEIQRQRSDRRLMKVAQGISSEVGEMFFRSLVRLLVEVTGADHAFVGELVRPGTIKTTAFFSQGRMASNNTYFLDNTPCEQVLKVEPGELMFHSDRIQELFPDDSGIRRLGARAYLGMPLTDHHGRRLGVLVAMFNHPLTDALEAKSLLRIFATRAAAELERGQQQRRLWQEKERFRSLVEQAPLGVALIDPHDRYLYVNPTFAEITGYTLADISTDQDWFVKAFPDPTERLEAQSQWQSYQQKTNKTANEILTRRITCADGRIKTVELKPVKLRDDSVLVIYQDITDRIEAEQEMKQLEEHLFQAQKMEAIGTLAGGVAHDFNNLLQVMTGYLEILSPEITDETNVGYLKQVQGAADRAGELVQRLLTYSRKTQPELRPLDMNQAVESAVEMMSRTIPRMIELKVDLAPDLRPINGDPTQIEQVLLNLGSNARDAMPEGGRLTIRTEKTSLGPEDSPPRPEMAPGPYVRIVFADTGQGMDEETLQRVFEPFFTTKQANRGTGLGLATVFGIITGHGGTIDCLSLPGQGTSFTILLPAIAGEAADEAHRPTSDRTGLEGTERILLVDDEEAIRDTASTYLTRLGYRVIHAREGREAVEAYRAEEDGFEAVILDLNMPKMGGHQAMSQILALDPAAKIIIASGYADPHGPEADLDAAAGFIGKPYRLKELAAKIREVLNAAR